MNKNSIKEDIKTLKSYKEILNANKYIGGVGLSGRLCEELEYAIEHILSDYKRVLKENEKKDELIERIRRFLLKENKMRDYLDYQESEE